MEKNRIAEEVSSKTIEQLNKEINKKNFEIKQLNLKAEERSGEFTSYKDKSRSDIAALRAEIEIKKHEIEKMAITLEREREENMER